MSEKKKKEKIPQSVRLKPGEMEKFYVKQINNLHPIMKAQERINAISRAMAYYICVPGGYVGPRSLIQELHEAYEERRRREGR